MILFILFTLLNIVMSQIPNCQTIETQWNATCADVDKAEQCNVDMSDSCKTLKTYYKQQICCDKDKTSLQNINNVAVNILDNLKKGQVDLTSSVLIQGVIDTDSSVGAIAWNTWLNSNTVTETIVDDIKDVMKKNNIKDFQMLQVGNMIKVVFDDRTPTRRLLNHREVLKNNLNEFELFDKNKMQVSFKAPNLDVTNGDKTLVQNVVDYSCKIITSQDSGDDSGTDFVQNSDGENTENFCVGVGATCPENYGYYPFGTCSGCEDVTLNGKGTKYKCYKGGGEFHTDCVFNTPTDIGGECHKCPSNKKAFGGLGFALVDGFFSVSGCMGGQFASDCSGWKEHFPDGTNFPVCPGNDFGVLPGINNNGRITCSNSEETNNEEECPPNRLGGLDINSVRL